MFLVLYTHQKAKKAKTWQDGILKVNGTKALLCDGESKTLDSFFVHKDQVALGEEIESDRYLITIEESLNHPSSNDTRGVTLNTVEDKGVKGAGFLYQPGKRKRQQREDNNPQNKRLTTVKNLLNTNDFFNMYSAQCNKAESGTRQEASVTQTAPSGQHAAWPTWQQHDQRVPLNMAGHPKSAGKENQLSTSLVPSSSSYSPRKECLNNKGCNTESKRSTAQILALFSSARNTPQLKMVNREESVKLNKASAASQNDAVKLSAQTNSIPGATCALSQPKLSLEQNMFTDEDLCDSLNLSPDSFTACSIETKAESTCTSVQGGEPQETHTCNTAGGSAMSHDDDAQESVVSKSPYNSQNDLWSQNDSESVSPLMRCLTKVEKDLTRDHSQACFSTKQEREWLCDVTKGSRELDPSTAKHASSVIHARPSLNQPSPDGFQTSVKAFSGPDMVQPSPLLEPDLLPLSTDARSTCTAATGYKSMLDSQSRDNHGSVEGQGISSHPGALFTYSALQEKTNHVRKTSDANFFDKGLSSLELWNTPFKPKGMEDTEDSFLQSGLSPEFYPPQRGKITKWRVAPVVTTKVIPTDSRTVKAGDGHSWKGSVVSDTVKRGGCPSVPVVSVQRRTQLHTRPSYGDQRAPSCDMTGWIDSIPLTEVREDSPCSLLLSAEGFATSESIALSSTEGFIGSSQLTEQTEIPEFVQRVPQLSRRRAPMLTAPPEDHDTQHAVPLNTQATGTCSTELIHETTVVTGPSQREASRPCEGANVAVKEKDTEHSMLRGYCPRIGIRRVGLERARDLPPLSQTREQVTCQQKSGFRPPTAPGFLQAQLSSGDRGMAGELSFPSADKCDSVTPTRHVTVPVTFENVMQYRQVFKAALREHLNIVLFELARTYHSALNKVDVSGFGTHKQGSRQSSDGPSCPHGQARLKAVKKAGPNKRRLFYSCPGTGQAQCKLFKWADEYQATKTGLRETDHKSSTKLTLSSPDSLEAFLKSHNVAFYCECHLIRKHVDTGKGKFGAAKTKKWGRPQRSGDAEGRKKGLYLELPRKEHSSVYSKDDIWIISKNLWFDRESAFIASSAYYGPSSGGELEIIPISGYSPSNWQSGEIVHALMACNAGTELSCISNIDEHVKMQNMPVLPYILHSRGQTVEPTLRSTSRASSFVPPMLRTSCGQLDLALEVTEGLAEEMIARFNLNKDQAAALQSCARMFSDPPSLPVCLIHGVFGAGKSFLLAVVVLYLVELFKVSDSLNHQCNAPSQLKILVSSTTNVAVDRILLGLLELGFEEFVRVGSIRKIAKPLLPYSVHSTGSDSQELKELQALLKGELTPSERTHVRKSIDRHKLGENKKKLSQVRVVGVTCAACVFPCLDKLKFPVLLLDECSQMTEPASLLPMARFECQKLVLVGDPKQLSPTIQGSEPEHEAGLEQTLFYRLRKLGYQPTLLRTQYRCHPAISAISNSLFYENKLLNGVTAEDRSPVVNLVPTLCFYNVARGKEKCGGDGSYYNEEEAKFVVFLIERLLQSGVEPAQMGVITLYKSQLHIIANHLTASRATSYAELKTIQISTVDAFQGGEKDLIILSCVRTDHIGFIDCDRRTNVALTRAKRHLLIVGNLKMLSCNAVWGKVIEHCRDSPNGLCNSQDFMKKCPGEESIAALEEGPVIKEVSPEKGTEHVGQTSDVSGASAASPAASPFTSRSALCVSNGKEEDVAQLSGKNFCVDIGDISVAMDDADSDVELPTFDLVSSLGI